MGYIVAIILLLIGILSHYNRKTWLAPEVLFCYMWSCISFFASLRLYGMYDVGLKTWLIILVGSIFFVMGAHVVRIISVSKNLDVRPQNASLISKKTFWIVSLILLLSKFDELNIVIQLVSNGVGLGMIRAASYGLVDLEGYVNNGYAFSVYIGYIESAIQTIIIAVSVHYFATNPKQNYIYILLGLSLTAIEAITTGSRFCIAYLIIDICICFTVYNNGIMTIGKKMSKKSKRIIVIMLILGIGGILIISSMRGIKIDSFLQSMYYYFCGDVVLLDIHVLRIDKANFRSFGMAGLWGITSIIFPILKGFFGIPYIDLYLDTSNIVMVAQTVYSVGSTSSMNAFVTQFYYLYADFRWLGIAFGMFVFGGVCGYTFKKLEKGNAYAVVAFCVIVQAIFKSLHLYPIVSTTYIVIFLILIISKIKIKLK